jgi:hypothetical protein
MMVMMDMSSLPGAAPGGRRSSSIDGEATTFAWGFVLFGASFSSGPRTACTAEFPVLDTLRAARDAIALEWAGRHGRGRPTAHRSGSSGAYTAANTGKDATKFSFETGFASRPHDLSLRSLNGLRERRSPAGALAVSPNP